MRTIVLTLILLGIPGATFSQEPYDAGVFFDTAGTQSEAQMESFVPSFAHLIAFDLEGLVKGFEIGFEIDPRWTVLGRIVNGVTPICGDDPFEIIIGTGGCVEGSGAFVMASYQLGWFADATVPSDLTLCLTPVTPSSFWPPAPGYLRCDGELVPYGVAQNGQGVHPNGCAVVNPTAPDSIVAREVAGWGTLKVGY